MGSYPFPHKRKSIAILCLRPFKVGFLSLSPQKQKSSYSLVKAFLSWVPILFPKKESIAFLFVKAFLKGFLTLLKRLVEKGNR